MICASVVCYSKSEDFSWGSVNYCTEVVFCDGSVYTKTVVYTMAGEEDVVKHFDVPSLNSDSQGALIGV